MLLVLYEKYQMVALALILMIAALSALPGYFTDAGAVRYYSASAQWVQQRYQPGDGIICFPDACTIPMSYYFWAYPGKAQFDADSPGITVLQTGEYTQAVSPDELQTYSQEHSRVFLISTLPEGDQSNKQVVIPWLQQHYALAGSFAMTVDKVHTQSVLVQLYVRGPSGP